MRRRWNGSRIFLLLMVLACGGCAGRGGSWLPWGGDSGPGGDITEFKHPAAEKASPMQTLAAALTFGRSASKANEEAARKAASIQPGDPLSLQNMPDRLGPEVHIQAARLYEIQNNVPQAMSNYERALTLDPKNETALVGYARLYDRQGQFEKATELYSRAIEAHPENARIHNDLAICLNRQGRTQESLQAMQRAIELQPKEALYRNNIAKMLVQAGRDQEALQQLSAVFPPPAAHYNVGYMLFENKRSDLANQYFAKALELQPGFAQAGKMLQVVQAMAQTPQAIPTVSQPTIAAQSQPQPPQSNGPALQGPALMAPQAPQASASRFSQFPTISGRSAPAQQPYADEVLGDSPALTAPVVEIPQ